MGSDPRLSFTLILTLRRWVILYIRSFRLMCLFFCIFASMSFPCTVPFSRVEGLLAALLFFLFLFLSVNLLLLRWCHDKQKRRRQCRQRQVDRTGMDIPLLLTRPFFLLYFQLTVLSLLLLAFLRIHSLLLSFGMARCAHSL